jgi:hypothetical protein
VIGVALLGATFAIGSARAELEIPQAHYPTLPQQAADAEGFVPAGWRLETRLAGDLNRDGIPDLVLVLREHNPKNIVSHDLLGENPLDTNPRILAVAFGRRSPGGFGLALQNHKLIPRRTVPAHDDFLDENAVLIVRGNLHVRLGFHSSAGSWETFTLDFTFRHRNGKFELIGYDYQSLMRNTGQTTGKSINYLTGKVRIATGDKDNEGSNVRWKTVPKRALATIEQVGDGMAFDPKY